MVEVTVKFYGILQQVVGNEKNRQFILQNNTVEGLISKLIQHYGKELKAKLIDPQTNQITDRLVMFVNGIHIKTLQGGVNTELKDGDLIALFPPSGGG